jgi:hypothetical protein
MGTDSSLWLKNSEMMGGDTDKVGTHVIHAASLEFYVGNASPRGKRTFTSYTTDLLTSKMWILPDGRVTPLSVFHYEWLLRNPDIAEQFGIPLEKLPREEDAIRVTALRAGLVRMNYEHKTGMLTVEVGARKLTAIIKRSLMALVRLNAQDIYHIRVNLIRCESNAVQSVQGQTANLVSCANNAKADHIPFVTELASTSRSRKVPSGSLKTFSQRPTVRHPRQNLGC